MALRRFPNTSERGYTLAELMAVVAIIGILATLSVYGVGIYVRKSKTGEAISMMTSIKGAQEAYKAETFEYLPVSNSYEDLYPRSKPELNPNKKQWGGQNTEAERRFSVLGVAPAGPTYFSYGVVATLPGAGAPADNPTGSGKTFDFPARPEGGYVAIAVADLNGDGDYSYVVSHSFNTDIYIENEGD